MNLPVVFRRAAQAEFNAATAWYEGQRPGLGDAFIAEVQRSIATIAEHPERFSIAEGDVRAALVSRFPYCVYYRSKPDRLVVIPVFHTSRDPSAWKKRT